MSRPVVVDFYWVSGPVLNEDAIQASAITGGSLFSLVSVAAFTLKWSPKFGSSELLVKAKLRGPLQCKRSYAEVVP